MSSRWAGNEYSDDRHRESGLGYPEALYLGNEDGLRLDGQDLQGVVEDQALDAAMHPSQPSQLVDLGPNQVNTPTKSTEPDIMRS